MLRCSVDHVRRIPRAELPAAKIGRRVLYQRADVIAYVRAKMSGQSASLTQSNQITASIHSRKRAESSFSEKFGRIRAKAR